MRPDIHRYSLDIHTLLDCWSVKGDMTMGHGIYKVIKNPQECFLTRVPRNIIRGLARNCGINT